MADECARTRTTTDQAAPVPRQLPRVHERQAARKARAASAARAAREEYGTDDTQDTPDTQDTDDRNDTQTKPARTAARDVRQRTRALFARLRTLDEGTPEHAEVRNALVELNLPLVRFTAARFRSRGEPVEDLVQVGVIGLIKSINRFDITRGVEFPTFAVPTVEGEIKRYFRDAGWAVRVPRRLQELRMDLARADEELTQYHDRAPTDRELADRLGIPEEVVAEGQIARNAYTAGSLDAALPGDLSGSRDDSLSRRLAYEEPAFDMVEAVVALRPLIAELSARERLILRLRFVDDLTQREVGAQLGISQMHVSRLLSRTFTRLRRGLLDDRRAATRPQSRPSAARRRPQSPARQAQA
ncbi:SigB/SigF/SigG family RNA polymerase sigma factor [Yinghuangia sp. KLBMP8922]|uniref:SigB/SigF/SigG family RNA polymerase sigma factor n=1 Tax=Yinghuangia soli TaxID=2908204 RepID=A0AA41TZK3_9ACTN|nr:SigB/SigF/SigG family RNA polymerase sigma factor [Yinghuangia soli]MCF2527596.1 SigB/SigF/SigG family RNA polymerase sigma factor [Yinghuangia soli]